METQTISIILVIAGLYQIFTVFFITAQIWYNIVLFKFFPFVSGLTTILLGLYLYFGL